MMTNTTIPSPVQFGLKLRQVGDAVEVSRLSRKDTGCLPLGTRLTVATEGDEDVLFINHQRADFRNASQMSQLAGTLLAADNFNDLPERTRARLRQSLGEALAIALNPAAEEV